VLENSAPLLDLIESSRRRDAGCKLVETNNKDWVTAARLLAIQLACQNGEVTSDDIQQRMPRPEWVHPNSVGAIFRCKQLKFIGHKTSERVSAHARRIGVYVYVAS